MQEWKWKWKIEGHLSIIILIDRMDRRTDRRMDDGRTGRT